MNRVAALDGPGVALVSESDSEERGHGDEEGRTSEHCSNTAEG